MTGRAPGLRPPARTRRAVLNWGVLAVVLLAAAACGSPADGPPAIVMDRTACSHCGMLISEPIYAAAYRAPGAEARVFDDIGCLRRAAGSENRALTFWFHDAGDRRWINGTDAVFVASPEIRSPMGGGVLAFRGPAAARRAAATNNGQVIHGISDLLSAKGAS